MPSRVLAPPRGQIRRLTTVPALLSWRAEVEPHRLAIEVRGTGSAGQQLTFGRWAAEAAGLAGALMRRGLQRGDRVGLAFGARDWTAFAVGYVGVLRAGGVAVPYSDRTPAVQVRRLLADCDVRGVLHAPGSAVLAPDGGWAGEVAELVADGAAGPAGEHGAARPDDLAQILSTSGTTGRPKAVGASHLNLTFGAGTDRRRMPLAHSDRFLHAFPIGTNAAQTMLLNALVAQASMLTVPQFTPARFGRLLASGEVGTVFLVPSIAIELLTSRVLAGRDLSAVHLVGSTAAPLPPAVAAGLAAAFPGAAIVNTYTSTEAVPAQVSMIFDPSRGEALGRPAGGTVTVADGQGRPVPVGTTGTVWLRAPHARSYLGDAAASRETFRDGWVRMGDLGRLDAEGYLYLVDRESDVVKSGAYKVSTLEVEAALHEHPDVAEAAVVGVPHRVLGSCLAAAVVPRAGVTPTLPAIREFLAARLADHQLPTRLLVLDGLPRNEAGKVLKRRLATRFSGADDGEEVA